MAYEFKKLSEVEALSEVPENATVLAEVDGSIKRIPSNGLGGAGGIKTAIIMSSDYYDALAGVSAAIAAVEYNCTNMTFEEAYQSMASGEPLTFLVMFVQYDMPMIVYACAVFVGTMEGEPMICFNVDINNGDGPTSFTWTSTGIVNE